MFHVICSISWFAVQIYEWRATEPHTPHPRARLEAVAELNRRLPGSSWNFDGDPTEIVMVRR
jgi:hypothetical protein